MPNRSARQIDDSSSVGPRNGGIFGGTPGVGIRPPVRISDRRARYRSSDVRVIARRKRSPSLTLTPGRRRVRRSRERTRPQGDAILQPDSAPTARQVSIVYVVFRRLRRLRCHRHCRAARRNTASPSDIAWVERVAGSCGRADAGDAIGVAGRATGVHQRRATGNNRTATDCSPPRSRCTPRDSGSTTRDCTCASSAGRPR